MDIFLPAVSAGHLVGFSKDIWLVKKSLSFNPQRFSQEVWSSTSQYGYLYGRANAPKDLIPYSSRLTAIV